MIAALTHSVITKEVAYAQKRFAKRAKADRNAWLDLRFCDLPIQIAGSPLQRRTERLRAELRGQGITFRPHFWLSTEWFSPDGVPGIALPFYLADARLTSLERRLIGFAEGQSEHESMKLLRHEMGHVLCTAYRLHYKRSWREIFGRFGAPYPSIYKPNPASREYVLHLDDWYAQAHPAEDFAETFAVWLGRPNKWRREYRDWPALEKLEYVDELMREHVCGKRAKVVTRRQVEPLRSLRTTLREHYAEKEAHFAQSGNGTYAF